MAYALGPYISGACDAAADNRDLYHLNTGELGTLQTLVNDHYDRASRWASNLLCAAYGICSPPHTGSAGEPRSATHLDASHGTEPNAPALIVQPNPAATWAAFSYTLPTDATQARIAVRDIGGRSVYTTTAHGAQGQVLWDTRAIAAGLYSVELEHSGRTIAIQKVVVQP